MRLCVLILALSIIAFSEETKKQPEQQSNRWENDIKQFENWDSKNSYPKNAVLFVGSSSIRMWPTRESFEDLAVINRGFGGSQICDSNHYFTRIVLPYKPRVILLYAGDNDIASGKTPQQVFEDYKQFVGLVRESLPKTPVIYVGIKPSGSRWSLWPAMKQVNEMVESFCKEDKRLMYFDSAKALLGEDGKPIDNLFLGDRLHLNAEGYNIWTKQLKPLIQKALKSNRI